MPYYHPPYYHPPYYRPPYYRPDNSAAVSGTLPLVNLSNGRAGRVTRGDILKRQKGPRFGVPFENLSVIL